MSGGKVQLFIGDGFDAVWTGAGVWLREAAQKAMWSEQPWAVVAPHRSWLYALKGRALEEGISLAGVWFLMPGEARDFLRGGQTTPKIAVREHLHLLAATAATECGTPQLDIASLLRALDLLGAANWPADQLDGQLARNVSTNLLKSLKELEWITAQQFDWALAANPPPDVFDRLLIVGFDATHANYRALLRALARSARRTEMYLPKPRLRAESVDQLWIGTWEEEFGNADEITCFDTSGKSRPFQWLAEHMENPQSASRPNGSPLPYVLVARSIPEAADAAVYAALSFASEDEHPRIGIVVPGPGALAREIAGRLGKLNVRFYDAFGHPAPPSDVEQRWRAWTAFQRERTFQSLMRLADVAPPPYGAQALAKALEEALHRVLVEDVELAAVVLSLSGGPASESKRAQAAWLRSLAPLGRRTHDLSPDTPPFETLEVLAQKTRASFERLGWGDLLSYFDRQWRAVAPLRERKVAVTEWLNWLDAIAPQPPIRRYSDADQPYARLHLLSYGHAEGLRWTHLVLTGLNEGDWPPPMEPSALLPDATIDTLNKSASRQGRFGQGHWTLLPDRSLLLGPTIRRELLRRQFFNLVEAPEKGLALICAAEQPRQSGRSAAPGDYLAHLFFRAFGAPLTDEQIALLCRATEAWMAAFDASAPQQNPQPPRLQSVIEAYQARRKMTKFSRYECVFDTQPPPARIRLSCRAWEEALRAPQETWWRFYLGVHPRPDFSDLDPRPAAIGRWVHEWLAFALADQRGRWSERYSGNDLSKRLADHLAQAREELVNLFKNVGAAVPHYVEGALDEAEWQARAIANILAGAVRWPLAAAEWNLPPVRLVLGTSQNNGGEEEADDSVQLLIPTGRIDLLLAEEAPKNVGEGRGGLPDRLLLWDYKTGSQEKPLTEGNYARALKSGRGVQIGLYALALNVLGAKEVRAGILTTDANWENTVSLNVIRSVTDFWKELARMEATGEFGMLGEAQPEFGSPVRFPLATLPVPPDLLANKWDLTHPALVEPLVSNGDSSGEST